MEDSTHVFNERLKRIEPVSKKCSYCFDGIAEKVNDSYFVPIFREKDRTNIIVYRSVKYAKIDIGIPRCANCRSIHEASKKKALVIAMVAAAAVLAFTVYNFIEFNVFVSVILFFLAGFVGFGGYVYLQNNFSRKAGINTLKEGVENDPLVQDFLMKGWSLTLPSA
ncbi:hypothetical protein [Ferruginibacter profundus]